jgi:hypothetical protein
MAKKQGVVCGVGIVDIDYSISKKALVNGKKKYVSLCPYYDRWKDMISRCYNKKVQSKFPTYANVKVCSEWLYFSKFKAWMEQQDWQGKRLDKDILSGFGFDSVYSPESCAFVTQKTNCFIFSTFGKGKAVGYHEIKNGSGFQSKCADPFKLRSCYLGTFKTKEDAISAYSKRKMMYAKELALIETDKRIIDALNKISEGSCAAYIGN